MAAPWGGSSAEAVPDPGAGLVLPAGNQVWKPFHVQTEPKPPIIS